MLQTGEAIRQVTASLPQTLGLFITGPLPAVLPPDEFTQLRPEKAVQPIHDRQVVAVVQVQPIQGQQEAVQEVLTLVQQGVVPDQAIHGRAEAPDQAIQGPQGAAAVVEGLIHQAVAVAVAAEGHTLLLLPDLPGLPLVHPDLPLHQVADEEDKTGKYADLFILQICIYLKLNPDHLKIR